MRSRHVVLRRGKNGSEFCVVMLRVIPLYLSRSRPLSSDKEEQPGRGGECPGCGKGAGVSSEQTQPGAKVCHAGIYHVGHLSPRAA